MYQVGMHEVGGGVVVVGMGVDEDVGVHVGIDFGFVFFSPF